MDPAEFLALVRDGGATAVLIIIIVGGLRGWYVWSWVHRDALADRDRRYEELERDRDWWRNVAMRSLSLGETAVRQRDDFQG